MHTSQVHAIIRLPDGASAVIYAHPERIVLLDKCQTHALGDLPERLRQKRETMRATCLSSSAPDTGFHILGQDVSKSVVPHSLYIEITGVCNLRCLHCIADASLTQGHSDLLWVKQVIDDFVDLGGSRVVLSGGEPLLYPHLDSLLQICTRHKLGVTIKTNATVDIPEAVLRYASEVNWHVSIEGSRASSNDLIRGKNAFARTSRGIQKLKEFDAQLSMLAVTLHRDNCWEAPEIALLAQEFGFPEVNFTFMHANGAAALDDRYDGLAIEPKDRVPVLHMLRQLRNESLEKIRVTGPIFDDVELLLTKGGQACGFDCTAGEDIKVDIFGNVFPCPYFTDPKWALGNVKAKRLHQLAVEGVFSKTVHKVRTRRFKLSKCVSCEWRDYCGGGCMAETAALKGVVDAEDVWCEERQHFYHDVLLEFARLRQPHEVKDTELI